MGAIVRQIRTILDRRMDDDLLEGGVLAYLPNRSNVQPANATHIWFPGPLPGVVRRRVLRPVSGHRARFFIGPILEEAGNDASISDPLAVDEDVGLVLRGDVF